MSYNIQFSENDYRIKTLDSPDEFEQNYRLRYKVFCEKLKWIPARDDLRDIDRYDDWSVTVGVFDKDNNLVGSDRIIRSTMPMMIEYEFNVLIPDDHQIIKRVDTVELTRFTVSPTLSNREKGIISNCIYKGAYLWCLLNDARYLYTVVEKKFYRLMRFAGLAFDSIGPMKILEGGVPTIAAMMDMRVFEEKSQGKAEFFQYDKLYIPRHVENEPEPALIT